MKLPVSGWPSSQGMHFVNAGGRTLMIRRGVEGRGPQGWPNNWYFHQPALEEMLREGVARFPNVTVHLGREIGDVSELDARTIVGCDGARQRMDRRLALVDGDRQSGLPQQIGEQRANRAVAHDGDVLHADEATPSAALPTPVPASPAC